ncbi:MAG TPA: sigma 54-interacting transcriptional regulator [Bryobacteraceae bacterium]|nr:sigma 54-interacting transcriptional regulator [Bryobacteraceae bacterium]
MPADSSQKYRALLEISEAFIACRDYDTLLRVLWDSLNRVIRFDYLALVRYDAQKQTGWVEAIVGEITPDVPLRTDLPLDRSPMAILLATGQPLYVPDLRTETRFRPDLTGRFTRYGILSGYWVPLTRDHHRLGCLSFGSQLTDGYNAEDRELMDHIGRQVTIAVENALVFDKIRELRKRIEDEKVYLEEEIRSEYRFDEIVGSSPALRHVLQQIQTAAPTDSTVLIQGETGTGKELVARAIHQLSRRTHGTFVKLNCSAIPSGLIESELLGHEKGAFTGALAQRIGRFELAHGGTLFLDEIGELPLELQPKLLRVLQDGQFERLGGSHTLTSDFRLVAATNRDLRTLVTEQKFRTDLYYRVNVFPITVPPLRERREDIPTLVRYFVQEFANRMRKEIESIPAEAMEALVAYSWPGNIRELRNVLERSVILSSGKRLRVPKDAFDEILQSEPSGIMPLADAERRHILDALTATNWIIGGRNGAAALLGLKRSTLQSRMAKLQIRRPGIAHRT